MYSNKYQDEIDQYIPETFTTPITASAAWTFVPHFYSYPLMPLMMGTGVLQLLVMKTLFATPRPPRAHWLSWSGSDEQGQTWHKGPVFEKAPRTSLSPRMAGQDCSRTCASRFGLA
jgi:hypothetical protein